MNFRLLNNLLGNVDLYLLDHILKGRFEHCTNILDAGSGEGRNLRYFISKAFQVYAVDQNPSAIEMLKLTTRTLDETYDLSRFKVNELSSIPFERNFFDAIICSAVLHFAENTEHFKKMFSELVRVANTGAFMFIRMASEFGFEDRTKSVGKGCYELPDGSIRFLLTKELFEEIYAIFPIENVEPPKSVIVHEHRCMTTLALIVKK